MVGVCTPVAGSVVYGRKATHCSCAAPRYRARSTASSGASAQSSRSVVVSTQPISAMTHLPLEGTSGRWRDRPPRGHLSDGDVGRDKSQGVLVVDVLGHVAEHPDVNAAD